MSDIISVGISTCPNDTFIFDAWINGKLGKGVPQVKCCLEDISTLNEMAFKGELDVVKVSFYAYGMLRDRYALLNAGGALGHGCGPLLVAKTDRINRQSLADPKITVAVPGRWTTANLLVCLYQPALKNRLFMRFEQIMPAVVQGYADAGVIIHEGRFTYKNHGLVMVEDLGAWWETTTGYPIPLGGIIAARSLGKEKISAVESAIRKSLRAALSDPDSPLEFMKRHAGEMDTDVLRSHVDLYVNSYSLDYAKDGRQAINYLMELAEEKGLFQPF
jgi:1,4-dihydroxy-6-naphthoate synthase